MFSARSGRRTILVVEDEDSLCELLSDELGALGYRVVIARNGYEGLSKLQDIEPDLIICDRSMPSMSGSELLERVRGVFPQYRDIPFIFLTAYASTEDRQAVQHLSPTAYLEKPLDFGKLKKVIEAAFAA